MQSFEQPPDGGPIYCLLNDDSLVKRITLDARPWFDSNTNDIDVLMIVTAKIVCGENADMTPPIQNIFLVL